VILTSFRGILQGGQSGGNPAKKDKITAFIENKEEI